MTAPIPMRIIFGLYGMVFLGAGAAAVIGLITGPRHWAQRLCKWTLWTTGIFLLLLTGTLLIFALAGTLRGEVETGWILLFINLLCFPLFCAFFGLLAVWIWRVSPPRN